MTALSAESQEGHRWWLQERWPVSSPRYRCNEIFQAVLSFGCSEEEEGVFSEAKFDVLRLRNMYLNMMIVTMLNLRTSQKKLSLNLLNG